MDRLISEQSVLDALCKVCEVETKPSECEYMKGLFGGCKEYEAIKAIPLVEQKIGRWIKHNTPNNTYYYDCSLCGCAAPCTETADSYLWKLSNFCPDCGAKMVGRKEETETCKGCTNKCIMYDLNMKDCKDKIEVEE